METPVAPETSSTLRGVLTPHHLRTDEISAIAVYEYRQKELLGLPQYPSVEIRFYGNPKFSMDEMEEFLSQGFLPVEIGEMSYKAVGAGSATEALVRTLGYNPAVLSTGEVHLMELLARRNRDGYMNQFFMSLPKNLKNVYALQGYDELDVITRFKDIVHAYIEYENRPEDTGALIPDELSHLVRTTARCQLAPFTPGRYLRDLCYRGEPADRIREKVLFWIDASNACQREYLKARDEWPKMEKLRFSYNGLQAAAVETANQFVSKVAFNREDGDTGFELVIIRNPESGHTAIMTRRKDVTALYAELERLEPGRWYRHESAGNLINGGLMYSEVTPTGKSVSELAGLVGKFPPR